MLATDSHLLLLLAALCVISLIGGYFGIKALKLGKLSVIEPINSLELPLTVLLSLAVLHETISPLQAVCILIIFCGTALAVLRQKIGTHLLRLVLERGAAVAFIGAICVGFVNLLLALASRASSPVFVTWFVGVIVGFICASYLAADGRLAGTPRLLAAHWKELVLLTVVGNLSWIAYATATTLLPVSIATAVSEAYIAVAVLLGIIVNRERLHRHQIAGILIAIIGAISLAAATR